MVLEKKTSILLSFRRHPRKWLCHLYITAFLVLFKQDGDYQSLTG